MATVDLAQATAQRIARDPSFELVAPAAINAVVFRCVGPGWSDDAADRINAQVRDSFLYGGRAVLGRTRGPGVGVYGQSLNAAGSAGVLGDGSLKGVWARHTGTNAAGAAVYGESAAGRGASFGGKRAQLRLRPSSATTHPASGQAGDFFVDSAARLWFCKGGTVWRQLA